MNQSFPDIVAQPARTREAEEAGANPWVSTFPGGIALALIVAGVLIFHAHARIEIYKLGYRLDEVTAEHAALIEQNKQLRYEVSRLSSHDRLKKIVAEKLGLTEPTMEQLRKIEIPAANEGEDGSRIK